jgi:hypothetical protein
MDGLEWADFPGGGVVQVKRHRDKRTGAGRDNPTNGAQHGTATRRTLPISFHSGMNLR